jgi:hypothetical protein
VGLLDYIRDALAFGATKRQEPAPSWKDSDPRYQYQPGKMESAHVAPVPKFSSPEEAQAWAAREFNGLPVNFQEPGEQQRYPGDYPWTDEYSRHRDADAMRRAGGTLLRAYKAGVKMPNELHVEGERPGSRFAPGSPVAGAFRPYVGDMFLNSDSLAYRNQGEVDDIILHEIGHAQDDGIWRGRWPLPSQKQTAETLNSYAATRPDEFVASAYADGARGLESPADVTALYKELNGPPIPRLVPSPR